MNLALRRANGNPNTIISDDPTPRYADACPGDNVRVLHPSGPPRSNARVARATGKWIERTVPIADLERYVETLGGIPDVYVTQNVFFGRRRVCNLAGLQACYVDLDYHNTVRWARDRPEAVAKAVLDRLEDRDLPPPSYIVSTGRGLLAVWLLEPTSAKALPRWMPVQQVLGEALHGFGVDNVALDAARVFRVWGSVNSKSGTAVRPVWSDGPLHAPARYSFDELADITLPFTRDELKTKRLEEKRARGIATEADIHSLDLERARSGRAKGIRPPMYLTKRTLWHSRWEDLERLLEHRAEKNGKLPTGQRDMWMLMASTAMSWLTPRRVSIFDREVVELAELAAGWSAGEARSRMSSIIARHEDFRRNKMITFNGREWDSRLHYKTETIIRQLDISQEEMVEAGLQVLITDDMQRARRTQAKRQARGSDEKAQTKAQAMEQAKIMHTSGATQQHIANVLGRNQSTIARWLKR
jgi:hypothetical protein